jgi:hypothetical protein
VRHPCGLRSTGLEQARARLVGSQQRTPMVFTAEEHVCLFRLETANKVRLPYVRVYWC